jgi:type I restriction enzyme R subunit
LPTNRIRSIYNQYADIFKYFDALQVGLTATPVEMVSHSTCRLFGCDYKLPTANYPLEKAIEDRTWYPSASSPTPPNSCGTASRLLT